MKYDVMVVGGGMAGLPLRVIPGQLSLSTMGNPCSRYSQTFFVDLNTGTTIDNKYSIIGLAHNITNGEFKTEMTMAYSDAYGKYENPENYYKFLNDDKKLQIKDTKIDVNNQ